MADKTWDSLNKGAYSAETAYTVGDFVSSSGSTYTCIQNTTGNAPTAGGDNAYWKLVASKGDTGAQGPQGIQGIQGIQGETGTSFTWKGDWSAVTTYAVRDVVYRLGSSYICIAENTNQEPPNATYWELVAQKGLDGEGAGDVTGPASAVSNRIVAFDGVTGKLIKDGGKTIAEVEAASIPVGYIDTDGTLAANSDTKVPTQKAVKTYADTKLAASSKAAGTDINTGTDDAKYVTSKAIADSKVSITDKVETLENKNLASPTLQGTVDGWISANETWTYASADDPTFTFTVAGVDLTTKYSAGMRIKLTQTTVKYFIITGVVFSTNTTITVYGGTDYDLANAAITSPYYSSQKAPKGFPLDPTKWTVETLSTTNRNTNTPTANTWYNAESIAIPIGIWRVNYQATVKVYKSAATSITALVTLSTANNSDAVPTFRSSFVNEGASGTITAMGTAFRENLVILAAKASYYLNYTTTTASAGAATIVADSTGGPTIIRAICAYL